MKRREFILAFGGAAAWPLVPRAQQSAMPAIGFLHIGKADAYTNNALAAFRRGLHETGYVEAQNVTIEYHFAENNLDRLPELAADLVRRQVAVIVVLSGGGPTALAAKAATSTIPIVIAFGSDPVKLGLAASMNRPGGNITGVTFYTTELLSKRLELLCDVVPRAKTIAYLRTGPRLSSAATEEMTAEALTTVQALGRRLLILKADESQEVDAAFRAVANEHADALAIASHPFFDTVEVNDQLAALTLRNAIPAIYNSRGFTAAGGLMSYGANQGAAFLQAGIYTGRILKGEKPADLPFQQSTRVEFVINLKTANALGISIPPALLARADGLLE
jgi:putative ABC transport system substrate-binding protein